MSHSYQFLTYAAFALLMVTLLLRKKFKKNNRENVSLNAQGLARITVAAVTATPYNQSGPFGDTMPEDLQAFIADLTPGEISTILLESAVGEYTERKKDIARAVTIAAALFDFRIPMQLICLDGRTHALYNDLMRGLEMVNVWKDNTGKSNVESSVLRLNYPITPPPSDMYDGIAVAGKLVMHFGTKGQYPTLRNFTATFNRNTLKTVRAFTQDEVKAMVTAYAAVTNQLIPSSYILYSTITTILYNAKISDKDLQPPSLALVQ